MAKGPGAKWELYNIATDRVEADDLAATEADRLKALVSQWEQYAHRTHTLPWIWKPAYTFW